MFIFCDFHINSRPMLLSFLQSFGGSPWELAVVLVAILLLFGAESLPKTLRTFGKWSEKLRRISQDLQREIQDVEEPFHTARKDWEEETRDQRVSIGQTFDDVEELPAEEQQGDRDHEV